MTNKEHITYIEEWLKDEYSLNPKNREVLTAALKALEELPKRRKEVKRWKTKVLERQKTEHWEWVQYDYNPKLGDWHCSKCRSVVIECVNKEDKGGIPLYKYCPQCGAKMVEPQESEVSNADSN